MSCKNIFHVGLKKEKQNKNNLQLKFYTAKSDLDSISALSNHESKFSSMFGNDRSR